MISNMQTYCVGLYCWSLLKRNILKQLLHLNGK